MAQGEQVHISSYPPVWPTRPSARAGGYDLRRAIRSGPAAMRSRPRCSTWWRPAVSMLRSGAKLAGLDRDGLQTMESPRAVSMIIGPTGEVISEVLVDHEGIVYAEIDVARCIEPKQFHDVVGYYNRFDIFRLDVDRTRLADIAPVLSYKDRFDHPPDSVSRCRELIAVAVRKSMVIQLLATALLIPRWKSPSRTSKK